MDSYNTAYKLLSEKYGENLHEGNITDVNHKLLFVTMEQYYIGGKHTKELENLLSHMVNPLSGGLYCSVCLDSDINGWSSLCKKCNEPLVY